ncbi:MAG: HEAT repeat domain-containing protein [Candidatus Odinarchaeota archaeon]
MKEKLTVIFEQLKDENPKDRFSAMSTLNWIGWEKVKETGILNEKLIGDIIRAYPDDSPGYNDLFHSFRVLVVESLVKLGGIAVIPLLKALKSDNRYTCWCSTEALGKIGDKRAVKPLIQVLLENSDWTIRLRSAIALGTIGDKRAVKPLITALEDDAPGVRTRAVEALAKIDDPRVMEPLINALTDEDEGVRWKVTGIFGAIGNSWVVEPLIKALKDEDLDVFESAAKSLSNIGKPAIEPMIEILEGNLYPDVRWRFVAAIGMISDPVVVELLVDIMEDKDEGGDARREAAIAIGKLGDPRAVDTLMKAIMEIESDYIDDRVVKALGKVGDPRAVQPLLKALKDGEQTVRCEAVTAMGRVGGPQVVEPLIRALVDEDSDVRGCAAKALGKTGYTRVVKPLLESLTDEDDCVRSCAATGFNELGGSAVEPLLNLLEDKDEDWTVRGCAAKALGAVGDARAVEPLINVITRDLDRFANYLVRIWSTIPPPRDSMYYKNILESLGQIGDPRAIEFLIRLMLDESNNADGYYRITRAVANTLELAGQPALKPLLKIIQDPDMGDDIFWITAGILSELDCSCENESELAMLTGVRKLYKAIINLDNAILNEESLDFLGELKHPRTVAQLIATFENSDVQYRQKLAETLAKMGEIATEQLTEALNNGEISYFYIGAGMNFGAGEGDAAFREGVALALKLIGGHR